MPDTSEFARRDYTDGPKFHSRLAFWMSRRSPLRGIPRKRRVAVPQGVRCSPRRIAPQRRRNNLLSIWLRPAHPGAFGAGAPLPADERTSARATLARLAPARNGATVLRQAARRSAEARTLRIRRPTTRSSPAASIHTATSSPSENLGRTSTAGSPRRSSSAACSAVSWAPP